MCGRSILTGLLLALAACGGAPTNPTQDWVTIKATTPAGGTVLKAGDSVTFTVSVDATLVSAPSGLVRLLITSEGMIPLNNGNPGPPSQAIANGLSSVTLSDTVTIPADLAGTNVLVVVPIWLDDVRATGQFAKLSFPVR